MRGTAVAAVACVAAATAAGAGAEGTPSLRFSDLTPVMVKGARFQPGTMVRVVLRAGESKRTRMVHVSAGGGFTVAFGTLTREDRCSGNISLVAITARGFGAVYRLPTLACIDPHGPPTIAPGASSRQSA